MSVNFTYRDINRGIDTLCASKSLQRLRDLEPRPRGAATYYVPGARFIAAESRAAASQISAANPTDKDVTRQFPGLPPHLAEAVEKLGKRATIDEMTYVVLKLCRWRALQVSELAVILNRSQRYIQETYLRPLVRSGELQYTSPDNPAHPQQAYRTAKK
ncbi:MAG: hypothetical protein ACR2GW_02885 [Pyrinomonadaceae bacterium]